VIVVVAAVQRDLQIRVQAQHKAQASKPSSCSGVQVRGEGPECWRDRASGKGVACK
jgi:hypothetical protein